MKEIKLSIVIPLFNKQDTISRAIESVLCQEYGCFELIVVNDGSTDESLEIAKRYQSDPRVSVFSTFNGGVSSARNYGVECSSSDYVCFLDADDEWHKQHLREIVNLIVNNKCSVMFSTCSYVNNSLKANVEKLSISEDFFEEYMKAGYLINSSSACVRKKSFQDIGGFPVGVGRGEDIYVWFRLALIGKTAHSPRVLVVIHDDAKNRSANNKLEEIPYHIIFFSSPSIKIDKLNNPSFKLALSKSALVNGVLNFSFFDGFRLSLNYLSCSFKINKKVYLVLLLSFFIPVKIKFNVLRFIKKVEF